MGMRTYACVYVCVDRGKSCCCCDFYHVAGSCKGHILLISITLRNKGIFNLRRKFSFDDKDLSDEDPKSELEEEQRLETLTKELAKVARRQTSIIGTIQDQRNILLALATKAGVDAHERDSEVVI